MTARVGILIIGNEILNGSVAEENAKFLTAELVKQGMTVRRIIVVPDEKTEIIEALHNLLRRTDYVITSGGIGPTHDDITVEAVAQALDRNLTEVPDLVTRAEKIFGAPLTSAQRKMAVVPEETQLVESPNTRWPAMVVGRVFVLAGVPTIFRRGFEAVRSLLPAKARSLELTLFVLTDEWTLTPLLEETLSRFNGLEIGSYPVLNNDEYRVRLVLSAPDQELLDESLNHLRQLIPAQDVVRVERDQL
jgi:molybdenum cofactor synthesis domain-containing protein